MDPERRAHRGHHPRNGRVLIMEFLVQVHVRLPGDLPAQRREEMLAAELRRARELRAAGVIRRIWRIAGGQRNVGVWSGPDATTIHDAIASLPLYPWLEAEVVPLAVHPLEEDVTHV
jgi:muconolactone D-isomerase